MSAEPIAVRIVDVPAGGGIRAGLAMLLRLRARVFLNGFREAVRTQPFRIAGTAFSILLIWFSLYELLWRTFKQIKDSTPLESIVATPLIFSFFFLALTGMLAFSNAILSYGTMFRRKESEYLLAAPLLPRDIVIVRYIESLALSSWSLLLLGLPLMMAMARASQEPWSFYPLFLGLFVLFIPLPGAAGLLLAWLMALISPKTPRRTMILVSVLIIVAGGWWAWSIFKTPVTSAAWLKDFYDRVALVQNAMLPHTWVSKGINSAVQGQTSLAAFYLWVTLANALFASFVAVTVVSTWYVPAYARAQVSTSGNARRTGRLITVVADMLFAYLPKGQRLLAAKDLRTFFRDPLQWSQMAILLGLLMLYLGNVQRLWVDLAESRLHLLIGFLNLTAVSLILATFTSRFVFPLVSLEGQQLWLLGLLPLSRSRMLIAKFLYALTITLVAAITVMVVSVYRLHLPTPLAFLHVVTIVAICVGLCGVSIGMGARLPVFTERNPARIAGGFGGTISLLMSIALVVVSLAGVGAMSLKYVGLENEFSGMLVGWAVGIAAVNLIAAAATMGVGIHYFNRIEV